MIGAVFLFLLTKDLFSTDGAVVTLAYYLFLPYAVIASRAFQPDPLMVMLMVAFWWAFHRWAQRPSWRFVILAGLFGGFAIFVKFVAVFFVIGAAFGEALGHYGWRDLLRRGQLWAMAALGATPGAAYLFYGLVLNGFLSRQFEGRFIASLLLSPLNYVEWVSEANLAVGGIAIMLGLLGLLLARGKEVRAFLIGLWAAYLLFGLYFNYAIATHDYYQEPLIPLVAISLAPVADWILARLAESTTARWMRAAACVVLLYGLLATLWEVRSQLKSVDFRPQTAMWAHVGTILNHAPSVAALTQDYGVRLAYWGWQNAAIWPNSGDLDYHTVRGASFQFADSFAALTRGKQYFLVTDFAELARQPRLRQQLEEYTVSAQGNGYVIYDLAKPRTP
jgi:4-amino-4-deoxy-L-arabinose transferase-like glycosyltransferase